MDDEQRARTAKLLSRIVLFLNGVIIGFLVTAFVQLAPLGANYETAIFAILVLVFMLTHAFANLRWEWALGAVIGVIVILVVPELNPSTLDPVQLLLLVLILLLPK